MPGEHQQGDILDEIAFLRRVVTSLEGTVRTIQTTKDLGNISGKTSAQLDALYPKTPGNGTVAVGNNAGAPVLLHRYAGKWQYSAAMTQIA